MKRLCILAALLIAVHVTSAQYKDQIYIDESTRFEGTVIEQKPGEYIRLVEDATTDTLTFEMEQIYKLVRVPVTPETKEKSEEMEPVSTLNFNSNKFALGVHGALGSGDVPFIGMGLGLHYRIRPNLSIGFVPFFMGENSSSPGRRNVQWLKLPLTVQATYELQSQLNGRGGLYIRSGLGYSITLDGDYKDRDTGMTQSVKNGLYLNPAIGYRINFKKNLSLALDLGYILITDRTTDSLNRTVSTKTWDMAVVSGAIFF